jgi:hypothetical protein
VLFRNISFSEEKYSLRVKGLLPPTIEKCDDVCDVVMTSSAEVSCAFVMDTVVRAPPIYHGLRIVYFYIDSAIPLYVLRYKIECHIAYQPKFGLWVANIALSEEHQCCLL